MKILFVSVLLFLSACATQQEKTEWEERAQRADDRYQEVKQYCDARGLPVGVDCEAGRACHKYPNSREKMTAHCVIWRDKVKVSHTIISDRVFRDMERQSRRRLQ